MNLRIHSQSQPTTVLILNLTLTAPIHVGELPDRVTGFED